jgi:hypothetical protein
MLDDGWHFDAGISVAWRTLPSLKSGGGLTRGPEIPVLTRLSHYG